MANNSFVTFFHTIIDSLEKHDLSYVLVGGTVMPYYGNVRSTQDIDIMLLLDEVDESLTAWLDDLELKGLVFSKSEIMYALKEYIHSNIFDPASFVFRVDLKRIHTTLDYLTYQHRQEVTIHDRNVWINCPESQIGVKISKGFRSSTDLEDVQAIVQTIKLDPDLLKKFATATQSLSYLRQLLEDMDTVESHNLLSTLNNNGTK